MMKDISDVIIDVAEPESSVADQLDLVVHPLQGSIGDSQFCPGQDAIEMLPNLFSEFFHGFQPTMTGPPEPLFEMFFSPPAGDIIPELLETLFKEVSSNHSVVQLDQIRETALLLWFKVPGILQKNVAGFLKIDFLFTRKLPHLFPADFIQSMIEMLDDVEPVEENLRLRKMTSDRLQVGRPHVTADGPDRSCLPFSQPLEELIQSLLFSVLSDPDQLFSLQVVDQREIVMTFLAADLVNADYMQGLPFSPLQSLGHSAPDYGSNYLPIEIEVLSHFLPTHLAGQKGNGAGQIRGHPAPTGSPGNFLDTHSTDRTLNPVRRIGQNQRLIPDGQVPPAPFFHPPASMGSFQATDSTEEVSSFDSLHCGDEALFVLPDLSDKMTFQAQAFSDISLQAHRFLTSFLLVVEIWSDRISKSADAPLFYSGSPYAVFN